MIIKNIRSKYVNSFRHKGLVRIGSFSQYRKDEAGIGKDMAEGTKRLDISINEPLQFSGNELGKLISSRYVKVQGTGQINIKQSLIVNSANLLPDVYLFCASLKIINKFGEGHYNIEDAIKFGEIIFNELNKIDSEVYDWAQGLVKYGRAKDPVKTYKQLGDLGDFNVNEFNINDCFCKPIEYAEEEEYRFVFLTKKRSVPEETYIRNKNLISCCSFN